MARTTRRRVLVDPRFAIGLLLVVVSVLGVLWLVSSASASVEVLAARITLLPGQRVRASDLVETPVRVGHTAGLYLTASDVPSAGVLVTRAIGAGELVPQSAVGRVGGKAKTSIVVTVATLPAASVTAGARVDLWSASTGSELAEAPTDASDAADGSADSPTRAPPVVLVSSALVVRLIDQKQLVASSGTSVELLVPKTDTASILDAIANGAALSVVPVDLSLGG